MATRALQVVITGDTRQFSRSINSAGQDVEHLEGRVKGSAGRASQALKGLAIAGAGVAAVGLKKSADAAIEAERSQALLVRQLKASGIAYKDHAKEINNVIQATSRLSGIDDEELQDAFTNIVRVTGDVNKSLRLTGLAADFARAKHMDVANASNVVAKVAGGNTGILSRYGFVINKNATASEALAALQKKFAGQAEAYGKTTAGALSRVNVASENVGETIGGHLTPIIAKAANGFVDFIAAARKVAGPASAFGKAWRKSAHDVGEAVSDAADKVKRFADRNRALINNIIGYMSGLIRFVTGAFTGKWGKAWDGLRDAVKNAIQGIGRILLLAGAALGRLALRIGDKILDGIVKGLGNLGDAIYGQIKKGINKAADKAKNLINKVNPFGDIGDGIGKQIGDGVGIGAGGVLPSGGAFGGSLDGARPSMRPFAAIGSRFGLHVSSGRGNHSKYTSSGNISYHSTGEAIDLADGRGPDANKMAFFKTMRNRFGSRLAELIYTPGGVGIKDGQPHQYTGQTAAEHFDHVHVAFDSGRPGIGDGIGRAVNAARAAGFSGQNLIEAVAIAGAESSYDPTRMNLKYPDHSIGLWQINQLAHHGRFGSDSALKNPTTNARAAYALFKESGFRPWSTYPSAAASFLGRARAAVNGSSGGGRSGGGGGSSRASGPYRGPRSGTVGSTTGGLGPGMASGGGQSAADFGVAEATARAQDNLPGLIAALSNELRLKKRRAKHIRRYLKRKRVSRANRQKFTEELTQLIGDIADLSGALKEYKADAKGGATTISGAEELTAGVAADSGGSTDAGATPADFANLAIAEAALTPGTGDDLAALNSLLGIRQGELGAARATGDPRKILEALNAVTEVTAAITALKEAVTLESDTRQRLIDLLAGVKDELKALNDNAQTLNAVGYREALKFMADSISGQVVGTNLQGRRQTAGNGRVAITP